MERVPLLTRNRRNCEGGVFAPSRCRTLSSYGQGRLRCECICRCPLSGLRGYERPRAKLHGYACCTRRFYILFPGLDE
eukprot:1371551-Amorphochlora_amoeboformis.AAC.2